MTDTRPSYTGLLIDDQPMSAERAESGTHIAGFIHRSPIGDRDGIRLR